MFGTGLTPNRNIDIGDVRTRAGFNIESSGCKCRQGKKMPHVYRLGFEGGHFVGWEDLGERVAEPRSSLDRLKP